MGGFQQRSYHLVQPFNPFPIRTWREGQRLQPGTECSAHVHDHRLVHVQHNGRVRVPVGVAQGPLDGQPGDALHHHRFDHFLDSEQTGDGSGLFVLHRD